MLREGILVKSINKTTAKINLKTYKSNRLLEKYMYNIIKKNSLKLIVQYSSIFRGYNTYLSQVPICCEVNKAGIKNSIQ